MSHQGGESKNHQKRLTQFVHAPQLAKLAYLEEWKQNRIVRNTLRSILSNVLRQCINKITTGCDDIGPKRIQTNFHSEENFTQIRVRQLEDDIRENIREEVKKFVVFKAQFRILEKLE